MNPKFKIAAAFVAGAAVGGVSTYFLVKNRLRDFYREMAEEEIESIKDAYNIFHKNPPYDNPETAKKAFLDRLDEINETILQDQIVQENKYGPELAVDPEDEIEQKKSMLVSEEIDKYDVEEEVTEEPVEAEVVNIFDRSDRKPDKPYVISLEEFNEENEEIDKTTIMYYEGDDTLADERDQIIPDIDKIVGLDSLRRFGDGSEDPNIVYVRNEVIHTDFEILRDPREYAEAVFSPNEWNKMQVEEPKRRKRVREDD